MFLGHYAVALGAKRAAPSASLGTLFAAAAFLDLIWPVLVLAGVERVAVAPGTTAFTPLDFQHYPISHSLLMAVVWGLAFGGVHLMRQRTPLAALVLALAVVSHWLLDAGDLPRSRCSCRPFMPRLLSARRLRTQARSRGATWGNGS